MFALLGVLKVCTKLRGRRQRRCWTMTGRSRGATLCATYTTPAHGTLQLGVTDRARGCSAEDAQGGDPGTGGHTAGAPCPFPELREK